MDTRFLNFILLNWHFCGSCYICFLMRFISIFFLSFIVYLFVFVSFSSSFFKYSYYFLTNLFWFFLYFLLQQQNIHNFFIREKSRTHRVFRQMYLTNTTTTYNIHWIHTGNIHNTFIGIHIFWSRYCHRHRILRRRLWGEAYVNNFVTRLKTAYFSN